jgi:hypothetical protein
MTDNERTLSIKQFCELEGLTEKEFLALVQIPERAPTMLTVLCGDGIKVQRIVPEARDEWHARLRAAYRDEDFGDSHQSCGGRMNHDVTATNQKETVA